MRIFAVCRGGGKSLREEGRLFTDIQRLFAFCDINRLNALFEYVLRQSGGPLETSKTASALGISRPTVESHLQALAITQALTLVRPSAGWTNWI